LFNSGFSSIKSARLEQNAQQFLGQIYQVENTQFVEKVKNTFLAGNNAQKLNSFLTS
jgi:hypothetical protein